MSRDDVIFEARNVQFIMLAPHDPTQNHLLAALPAADYKLQAAGLIHYGRGRITVRDRAQLEARVCECYGVVKGESELVLGAMAEAVS